MPRSGTLVICVQNLDFSGANQVVYNIVSGRVHESNVVVLSPKIGSFAARFVESGAAVRIGELKDLMEGIRDIFCVICNTIMTANIVVEMSERPHPVVWILHEWWDDEMIKENLRIRNYEGLTLSTVKQALSKAAMVVCVCESQRQLYNPSAPSSVIFVGVPDPASRFPTRLVESTPDDCFFEQYVGLKRKDTFTFLCLGIVCPRKNQLWTVKMFKKFAQGKPDVRLKVVGARHIRVYEIEYLEQVKAEIGDDTRIELLDVTDDVEAFYKEADCLVLTSLNEVTPMVISEAMSWGKPVISTNIAGIKEMFEDGVEGFLLDPEDEDKILSSMEKVYSDEVLRQRMGIASRARFESFFDIDLMVEAYRQLVLKVAPPVVLLDMDGALIDWDKGFMEKWNDRGPVDRSKSYYMEECVDPTMKKEADKIFHAKGFFLNLEPMDGALEALREMESCNLKVYICTAPIRTSIHCAQEKLEWVRNHLGEKWLDKVILCQDKTMVAGDLLIDDKPYEYLAPGGKHTTATWKQIIFDAPYNRQKRLPRMFQWKDWQKFVFPMLGKCPGAHLYSYSKDDYKFDGLTVCIPPRLKRDNSLSSNHSEMSAEEVQQRMDMLQYSESPLFPEEIASIKSGSVSLVGNNSDEEAESERKTSTTGQKSQQTAAKKKVLQDRLHERNQLYRKIKENNERKLALDSDAEVVEGLQLFRGSYNSWIKQRCSTPPSSKLLASTPPNSVN